MIQSVATRAAILDHVQLQTTPGVALRRLRQALADGMMPAMVLMDPAYGNDRKLRGGMSELGLSYAAGALPNIMVWRPGGAPLLPRPKHGHGDPASRLRRDATQPASAQAMDMELAIDAW